jgi:hypothetical protein
MKPLLLSLLSTLSVILGLVGLWVLGLGLRRMAQASRSRRWPTAQGTLLSSTVAQRSAPPLRRDEDDEDAPPAPPQTLYRPQVEYRYSVGPQAFTGTSLALEELEVSSEEHARKHAARYVPGSPVTVYYDPQNPGRAVLEPGVRAVSWALPVVGVVFLIATGALALFVRWYSGR